MKKFAILFFLVFMLFGCSSNQKVNNEKKEGVIGDEKKENLDIDEALYFLNRCFSKDEKTVYFSAGNKIYCLDENSKEPKVFYQTEKKNRVFTNVKYYEGNIYALIRDYASENVVGVTGLYYYDLNKKEFVLIQELDSQILGLSICFYDNDLYVDIANYNDKDNVNQQIQYKFDLNNKKVSNPVILKEENIINYTIQEQLKKVYKDKINSLEYPVRISKDFYLVIRNRIVDKYSWTENQENQTPKSLEIETPYQSIDIIDNYIYIKTTNEKIFRCDKNLDNFFEIKL